MSSRAPQHPDEEDTENDAAPAVVGRERYQGVAHDRTDTEAFNEMTPFGASRADTEPPPWMKEDADPEPEPSAVPAEASDAVAPAAVAPHLSAGPTSAELFPRQVLASTAEDPEQKKRAHARQLGLAAVVLVILVGGGAGAMLVLGGGGAGSPDDAAASAAELGDGNVDLDAKRRIKLKDKELGGVKVHGGGLNRKPLPPKRNLALPVQNAESEDGITNTVPDPQPIPTGPAQVEAPAEGEDDPAGPAIPDPAPPGHAPPPPAPPPAPPSQPPADAPAEPPAQPAQDGEEMAPPQVFSPDAR